jgi:hypothetical protein
MSGTQLILDLVMKIVLLDMCRLDKDRLHLARTRADLACTWLCDLIESVRIELMYRAKHVRTTDASVHRIRTIST